VELPCAFLVLAPFRVVRHRVAAAQAGILHARFAPDLHRRLHLVLRRRFAPRPWTGFTPALHLPFCHLLRCIALP
jgi:hypothetical protein